MASDRDVLPDTVKPTNYNLKIFDIENGGSYNYHGCVMISLDLKKDTKEVVLNANQLEIKESSISVDGAEHRSATDSSLDSKKNRLTISFDSTLPAGKKAVLKVKFMGTINQLMAGFYRSRYKPTVPAAKSIARDEEYHYMFSTQFESCDARRAFPCFDEPNLKASFDFSIEIPEDQVALSNMPEKDVQPGKKEGTKKVSFEQTPIMSTYLLAWAVGDFEYIEGFTKRKYNGKPLPVRVYTTRGLKQNGQYALEHAPAVIDYFSEIFKIDYPLPKADLLAVHEFSHGAMENWGLVTYRATAVLFDEESSDQKYKNRIAYVVAHELAHQWFGNLVTMDWWSELWLNEGFATWVGWLATDHLHPDWDIWGQFVSESSSTAFGLDSIRNSHPIEVAVKDALEVDQIFDAISYLKGSSVIRMLSSHLGVETFLQGVSEYLKEHAYGNATTTDLWKALAKVSGLPVDELMDPWIRKIGFPVITVAEEPGQITIQQKRFLLTGDAKPEEDETTWWIPLRLQNGEKSESAALTTKEDTIRDVDDSFYKINKDTAGFFRTNYPPARLAKLGAARAKLSVADKVGLVGDAAALATSGDGTTAGFLALIEGFQDEASYHVWSQALAGLANIRQTFSEFEDISKGLKELALKLVTPAAEKLGWKFAPNEDFLTGQLRALLIAAAGLAGHVDIMVESSRQFEDFTINEKKEAIHPSLRSAVFRISITAGTEEEYAEVKKEYLNSASIDGKELALTCMGRVQTEDLGKDFLDFLFSDKVAVQDLHYGSSSLAGNAKMKRLQWEWIKANWEDKVYPRLSGNMVLLERYLRTALNKFASNEVQDDIEKFFEGKNCEGFDRGLGVAAGMNRSGAKYKERDVELVREWLGAHGYL
ncbi:hypothetical protein K402DRAFT_451716 [Aulographum hederae CBS 113979]|uniref:Aminopeptidase n=1 Tax=Aulographum hederae CBS 113979 TaxID=1176131 RepID=A0A6G1HB21_9PEZI|nr:hypothetical protein K402DRAFT_451716 [Aulographum hederae CBS 113979]